MTFYEKISSIEPSLFSNEKIAVRRILDDYDLWFATVECMLDPKQQELVNPAGFSIGRAYLKPYDNYPCIICDEYGKRIGFINFCKWLADGEATTWSYYIDKNSQGSGYGKKVAETAVKILRAACPDLPIKLAVDIGNEKALIIYESLGFYDSGELDGDEHVFIS
ncbi:MAG: GNAT family N-acetyltransferase [Eubacteriales bacterium]|nr:GNAT family N-acetyltransferase [Eubacteriales bacterium]